LKTIVVTGARGYIGSALVKSLADQGIALRLISRSAVGSSGGPVKHAEYVQADLREEKSWRNLLQGADAVVHLSSRTDLRAAEADPAGDRVLNVEPIRALVRAAERSGTALRVVFASSTTVVGDTNINPVSEQTPDRPCSVYDRHKLECEIMLRDATHRGLFQACSLRLSTVYGYGNGVGSINPNRGILNAVMRGAANGQPPTIYGDGKYLRDYIFVGDVVDAFCRTLQSERVCDGRHYVIATGRGYTLADAFKCVAEEACRATGRKVEIRYVPEPPDLHPIQRRSFVGDSSMFRALTGWHPRVDLQYGIRDYFERLIAASQGVGVG
jgi:nucleoside-diphosphate-sugar epimerase